MGATPYPNIPSPIPNTHPDSKKRRTCIHSEISKPSCRGAPNTIPQTVSADKPPALAGAPAPRRLMVVFGDRQPVAAAPTLICHGAQKQGSSPGGRASSHQGQGARRPKRPLSRGASVPTHRRENAPFGFALAPSGPGHSRLSQKRR